MSNVEPTSGPRATGPEFDDATSTGIERDLMHRDASAEAGFRTELDLRSDAPVISCESIAPDLAEAAELAYLATHDRLTGLANRELFRAELTRCLAARDRSGRAVGLLFIDLDRFKQVNDVFGHDTGDQMLAEVGRRIQTVSRPMDLVARFGGDEFVVLCDDLSDARDASSIASRIVSEIGRPFCVGSRELSVGCSIGIAVATATTDPDELVHRADLAMYRAKRSRLPVATSAAPDPPGLVDPTSVARPPGSGRVIEMRYEPIIDLRTGEIRALRAGTLWNLAEPIDDELGSGRDTIHRLGFSVLERSLADLDRLCRDGLKPGVQMLVHLTAQHVLDARLSEAARAAVERANVDPARLIIGVEEQLLKHVDAVGGGGFGSAGCAFAVEAFGVAGSSVLRMGDLPADYLVIDERFVALLASDTGGDRVVAAIIELADVHGMEPIAAGVRRQSDLAKLRDLGCWAAFGPAVGGATARDELAAHNGVYASG